jgi:hypothetical protein
MIETLRRRIDERRSPGRRPEPAAPRDLLGVAGALRRYWWLTVPALLLTLGLAYRLPAKNTSPWQSQASLFLVVPSSSTGGEPTNPYVTGSYGLLTTVGLLQSAVQSGVAALQVEGQLKSTVDISVPQPADGVRGGGQALQPLVQVVVNARDEGRSAQDMTTVIDLVQNRLQQIQAQNGVSDAPLVSALSVQANQPHQLPVGRARPTFAIAAIGTTITVWVVLVLDRRRKARADRPVVDPAVRLAGAGAAT